MPKKKERTLAEMLSARTTASSRARLLSKQAPEERKRTFETTRGKRRLSFEEAYARRSTDRSRQAVQELYGKSTAPSTENLTRFKRAYGPKGYQPSQTTTPGQTPTTPSATTTPTSSPDRQRRTLTQRIRRTRRQRTAAQGTLAEQRQAPEVTQFRQQRQTVADLLARERALRGQRRAKRKAAA
jgi:hypothetical protein